jgi:hypothetical protein
LFPFAICATFSLVTRGSQFWSHKLRSGRFTHWSRWHRYALGEKIAFEITTRILNVNSRLVFFK